MRSFLVIAFLLYTTVAVADTIQSRDGEGNKIQGAAFNLVKSASIGTKGFKCFSTVNKLAWETKVVATASTDAALIPFKYSLIANGVETTSYPVSTTFFQWMNSPAAKSPTISKVCLRSYSSATAKTAFGAFQ